MCRFHLLYTNEVEDADGVIDLVIRNKIVNEWTVEEVTAFTNIACILTKMTEQ